MCIHTHTCGTVKTYVQIKVVGFFLMYHDRQIHLSKVKKESITCKTNKEQHQCIPLITERNKK